MATYSELHDLMNDSELLDKVEFAVIDSALSISNEATTVPNHPNRLSWAKATVSNPRAVAKTMLPFVLAVNKSATVSAIKTATDVSIQSNVDGKIDIFATG